jgi:hypothetical protein
MPTRPRRKPPSATGLAQSTPCNFVADHRLERAGLHQERTPFSIAGGAVARQPHLAGIAPTRL